MYRKVEVEENIKIEEGLMAWLYLLRMQNGKTSSLVAIFTIIPK